MPNLKLSFACDDYLHTRALRDGIVRPEGIDLTYLTVFPAQNFQRMLQFGEFDIAEMGMKFYISSLGLKDPPFIAIPVFPSRSFRHGAIFVNAKGGIESPRDLAGKRIGEPFAYGHDAAIWARGIMQDEYHVAIDSPTYCVGPVDSGTFREFAPFGPPSFMRVETLGPGQTLDAMLESGEIDALYSAIVPACVLRRTGKARRLFVNFEAVERDYYRKTGIFPIMHTLVMRREIYRQHPWVAQSLYQAFKEAKKHAYDHYETMARSAFRTMMMPWLSNHYDENCGLFGEDPWPYGVEPNRKALETFLRYHHEQGLSTQKLAPEELFAPETLVDYFPYRPART